MTYFNNYFSTFNTICISSELINKEFYLYENEQLIQEGITTSLITLINDIKLDYLYYLKIDNDLIEISKHNLYDTNEFSKLYNYDDTLGCIITDNIEFRVFAPTKYNIKLNIYKTGHEDDLIECFDMVKDKGIFTIVIDNSFLNYYYTYSVYDNLIKDSYIEVVDPYAKTCGVNGLRGMITDLSSTIKITSSYPKREFNEAIVYELHVRDLSVDDSWSGNDSYRGKFLGLIEENTILTKDDTIIKTGFDHIKELGITDLQLLPIFDFFMVDESRLDDPTYKNIKNGIFNWGYMGLNFNSLEGSYSTNPYDGITRVNEFKRVVQKYNENNIGIIMDVVYNHTAFTENSNFNILVPGYYHRMYNNKFSDGSACGNETASDRYMMRKFIVDSILFWASEYHLSGFRFDLMALHDVDTMNELSTKLKEIDSSIIVYGEPWRGGNSVLDSSLQANKDNLYKMKLVGAFNDELRDGVKGSVFDFTKPGFVQGFADNKMIEQIKYGIVGGINHSQINFDILGNKPWHTSSLKCVNYVSAHDNHTIWDKLTLSSDVTIKQRVEMQKQCNSIPLLSQGLSFIHAGSEFCRSKPTLDGLLEDNSYDSSDYTNKIRWDNKIDYYDVFQLQKNLIEFRKNNKEFSMSYNDILNIKFNQTSDKYISYTINNKYLILINNNEERTIELSGIFKIIVQQNKFELNSKTALCSRYTLKQNSINILEII